MTEAQRNALQAYYSRRTTDKIQPDFDDVKTVADNIESVKKNADNLDTIIPNLDAVNSVASIAPETKEVLNIKNEILEIISSIIPNLEEILKADTNAQIATNKSNEANISAALAIQKALDTTNRLEALNKSTYAISQLGISLTQVIDGELIMFYNDPITNIKINENKELIIKYGGENE